MQARCKGCGADLEVNRNLVGTKISCPRCGEPVPVPDTAPPAPKPAPRRRTTAPPPAPEPSPAPPYTAWLFGVQAVLALLGLSCLAGAFFASSWSPPEWSYFRSSPMVLVPVGIGMFVLVLAARRMPVLMSMTAVLGALWGCAFHYHEAVAMDASRVIALSLAMLALWLALQHRRT